jgi:hypothetical protein
MNSDQAKALLEERGVHAAPVHLDANAKVVSGLLKGTAERFAQLLLEAEPSGYVAEQRRDEP